MEESSVRSRPGPPSQRGRFGQIRTEQTEEKRRLLRGLGPAQEHTKHAAAAADYCYKVLAEVLFTDGKASVIDFGLTAVRYADLLRRGAKQGDFVAATIYVGVPIRIEMVPQDVPAGLAYDWRVNRISARVQRRLRTQYTEIESTAVLRAEHYVLHCTIVEGISSAEGVIVEKSAFR